MKVLKVIHTMGHGGAENIFRWLALGLKREGVEIIAGIPADMGPGRHENWIDPALAELGIPRVYFDKTGRALAMLKSMTQMIARVKPDIVHSHLLDANFFSSIACRFLDIPHVCTEHGDIRIKTRVPSRIKFALLPFLSKSVVCVSESLRRTAVSRCLAPGKRKLRTIYNGITFPEKSKSTFRKEQGIPDNALVVGNVGNLYPVKGQRYLIEAFHRFLAIAPEAYLVLVGRGDEEYLLRRQTADFKSGADRVIFTGFRGDVANILNALDIYVQPSLSEGFPVAVLEALSLDLPVIATAVGGVPEIITGEASGLLVSPGSAASIFAALKQIFEAQDLALDRSQKAGAFVRTRFSVPRMTGDYLNLYSRLVDSDAFLHDGRGANQHGANLPPKYQ